MKEKKYRSKKEKTTSGKKGGHSNHVRSRILFSLVLLDQEAPTAPSILVPSDMLVSKISIFQQTFYSLLFEITVHP